MNDFEHKMLNADLDSHMRRLGEREHGLSMSAGSAIRDALKQLEDAVGNMQCVLFNEDERKTRYLTDKLCELDDEIESFKEQNKGDCASERSE